MGSIHPAFGELAAGAAPTSFGVEGILDPAPARHALVLAAHLWSHEPFTRLLRLLDIALTAQAADPEELESVAQAWGLRKLWSSTVAVTDAVLYGGPQPWLLRVAGRGLITAREATVSEVQLARLLAPLAIHSGAQVPPAVWQALAGSLRPGPGESWGGKARRTARQLARPSTRHSENLRSIESGSSRIVRDTGSTVTGESGGRPDVSVVVATRNRAALLPHCLASLLEQETSSRFEVVVVDNGSEDGTADVIRGWAERDPRIRGVLEPAVGLSRAKNAGIEEARGELVLFTDDDVILDSAWIEAYVSFFARRRHEPRTLVGGPVLPLPHDLSAWPSWLDDAARVDLPGLFHGSEERALGRFDYIWGANMAARGELFAELGGFDEGLGRSDDLRGTFEDVELNERVTDAGGECRYLPAAVVHHRVDVDAARPRMIVRKAFNRGANDFLRAERGSFYAPSAPVPRKRIPARLRPGAAADRPGSRRRSRSG